MIQLTEMGKNAKKAAQQLAQLSTIQKNQVLKTMAASVRTNTPKILAANDLDMKNAQQNGVKKVMLDRLKLDQSRVDSMADGLEHVADLADPIGEVVKGWTTETGLAISQVRVPLGVIGMIYEARPNVTVDAAGLTFKAGSAVILRGGKEALQSNRALVAALREALITESVAEDSIQLITDTSHETATTLMQLTEYLDVLIPRGSAKFIQMVVQKAKVPVIETGSGNCHVYVDEGADLKMATDIIVNAKTQRPSVCNAMEKLVVNQKVADQLLPMVAKALQPFNVDLRGDERAKEILPNITLATEADWGTEYNDYIMAIKIVDNLDQAIAHINHYNTKHSEAIVTNNYAHSERFTKEIDAAVVYVNASTRFTDGFEFGFGAEIGISTQKLHARGPMGLNEITSTKYVIRGNGQVRK